MSGSKPDALPLGDTPVAESAPLAGNRLGFLSRLKPDLDTQKDGVEGNGQP